MEDGINEEGGHLYKIWENNKQDPSFYQIGETKLEIILTRFDAYRQVSPICNHMEKHPPP